MTQSPAEPVRYLRHLNDQRPRPRVGRVNSADKIGAVVQWEMPGYVNSRTLVAFQEHREYVYWIDAVEIGVSKDGFVSDATQPIGNGTIVECMPDNAYAMPAGVLGEVVEWSCFGSINHYKVEWYLSDRPGDRRIRIMRPEEFRVLEEG